MGGKGRKRREKNFLAAHGGANRLPPPPTASSINAIPSKLRKLMSFTSPNNNNDNNIFLGNGENQVKNKKVDVNVNQGRQERKLESKDSKNKVDTNKGLSKPHVAEENTQIVDSDANEEKKKKKRKRKQVNDLRFEAEIEKLGVVSKRRQRKKEYLKAKKKKKQKGNSEQTLDILKHDEIKFGEVVQAPPKLAVIPKAPKKPMDVSRERLRLQAIEAYRSRKGWSSRPGIGLPSISSSPDL